VTLNISRGSDFYAKLPIQLELVRDDVVVIPDSETKKVRVRGELAASENACCDSFNYRVLTRSA
jgi:hypothetical protein